MTDRRVLRRLSEFVDRDAEMEKFCAVLGGAEQAIMVVHGETGMGKTSLLMRMIHECSLRKMPKAEVVWSDSNPHDYIAVMRKVREAFGAEYFTAFTDLINYYTDAQYHPKLEITLQLPGSISVAAGMNIENSTVGDIAGVILRDNMFVVPRADLGVPEAQRREELTKRFLLGLKLASLNSPIAVFFDATEKMSDDTRAWLWEQLLDSVRNGVLANVRFVLCGQQRPPQDRDWEIYIQTAALSPLGLD
ncbi:MAG TPA: AAA family ATPase, partial [Vicinamibacterales bacterium]|nr:AAA family ATPase [Vicinamibacterales bacterium]